MFEQADEIAVFGHYGRSLPPGRVEDVVIGGIPDARYPEALQQKH